MTQTPPPAIPRPPGYTYGAADLPPSPVSLADLERLKQSAGFGPDDERWLRRAAETLADRAEDLVDGWRAIIAAHPHLAAPFVGPDGQPDEAYRAAVRLRFVQWVRDVCQRPYDETWLAYQHEIGRRHTPASKNQTDGARTPPVVPFRDLLAFAAVVQTSTRPLLRAHHPIADADRMHDAWCKAILLHLALWSAAYVPAPDW